jgi:hypothetical protein
MISSKAWACLVLSPATLHSVSGTAWCRCITRHVAAPDRWPTVLALGCRSAMLAWSYNLPPHTSHQYLMDHLLYALQTQGAALGNMRA